MPNLFDSPAPVDPTTALTGMPSTLPADPVNNAIANIPTYMESANLHNIASGTGTDWTDPETYIDKAENLGVNSAKFMAVSIMSGADSIYNSAQTVGSWAGLTDGVHDTGEWISSVDDDLGQYYQSNKQAADLAGFVMTSFVPGLAGTKLLNVGREALAGASASGVLGNTLSKATGLLVPDAAKYIASSSSQIASTMGTMKLINTATLQALGAGVVNNTLEAAAFETMVQATMFKSPILEDQSNYDIAKNIAMGGLLGGAIGGVFEGVRTISAIKRDVTGALNITRESTAGNQIASITPNDQKILLIAEGRDAKIIPTAGSDNYATNTAAYSRSVELDNNNIRKTVHDMTIGSDEPAKDLANMVADGLHNVEATDVLPNIANAQTISHLGVMNDVDKAVKAMSGTLTDESQQALMSLQNRYITLTGENAGNVLDAAPAISSIADTGNDVLSVVRKQGHSVEDNFDCGAVTGSTAHTNVEGRYIWADKILKEIPEGTVINSHDLPLLQRYQDDLAKGQVNPSIKVRYQDGSTVAIDSPKVLNGIIETSKGEVVNSLQDAMTAAKATGRNSVPIEQGNAAIAKIADVKQSFLEGRVSPNSADDLYATDAANKVYNQQQVAKGLVSQISADANPADIRLLPQYAKVGYDTSALKDLNGNVTDAMVALKQQQTIYQQACDNVAMKNMGASIFSAAPDINENMLMNARLYDASPGLMSFQSGAVGSLGSATQQIGANVTRPLKSLFRKASSDAMESSLNKLGANQDAAIEWQVLNNKIANTAEQYVQDTKGYSGAGNNMIAKSQADFYDALAAGHEDISAPILQEGAPISFPVKNQETWDAITAHTGRDADRLAVRNETNSVLGKTETSHLNIYDSSIPQNPAFNPIRPNPNDYKFVAFVKDDGVSGSGHTSMIHADSAEDLDRLMALVPTDTNPSLKVITKAQTEDYFKAQGEFSYDQSLNSNYIDSTLKKTGAASNYFTQTDPQKIINDIINQHMRADDVAATNLVRMKYQPAFSFLEDQAEQSNLIAGSKYGNTETAGTTAKSIKSPYTDFIKTALDISSTDNTPLLQNVNRVMDDAVSKAYDTISGLWHSAKTPEEMASINESLDKYGINTAYSNAATDALINSVASKGVLSNFIRTSNATLINLVMGLDPISGLHRALGSVILRSSVFGNLITGLENGDAGIAGKLADLAKIGVPGVDSSAGEASLMLSPAKLQAQAYKAWWNDITADIGQDGPLMTQAKAEGAIHTNTLSSVQDVLKKFTIKGTEDDAALTDITNSGFTMAKAIDLGKKYSGTTMLDEMNRFVSWHCGKQLTDLGEEAGLLTPAESMAYRNTLVNQVDGVHIASQRPLAFQGPLGQAMGLFQGYQFNMMQQMFKYIGEGAAKDTATMLGLQGTMYGLQGEPMFQAINEHVIGNMSGNKNHTDLYDAAQGILGKTAGDFLMYGMPSNMLQTNMYSRGDIQPRSLSILPTKIEDIPTVAAYTKLFGSLYQTMNSIAAGGNVWESVLQGIEHNGVSRPLAGLAQELQATAGSGNAFSTSSKGTIIGSNDIFSIASLSRLAGAKPLDESIMNDWAFRMQSYEAENKAQSAKLLDAIKTTQIQGQTADANSIQQFSAAYLANGGKQQNFNQFMMGAYKSANTPMSQKLAIGLSTPFAQKMQFGMGGISADNNTLQGTGGFNTATSNIASQQ